MINLRKGSKGKEVARWQILLNKLGYDVGATDGFFGRRTELATKKFQQDNNLKTDGIAGTKTMAIALKLQENNSKVDIIEKFDDDYPPLPSFRSISSSELESLFGGFKYKVNSDNSIVIMDRWAERNIKVIEVPQLKGVLNPYINKPISGKVYFHIKVHDQILSFFNELEVAGIHNDILSWGGSFVPRLVRGSTKRLSNHAFGTAFDINMEWNGLNKQPALMHEKGCVRHIAEIASRFGFYWGGHFRGRKDGMHFEISRLL